MATQNYILADTCCMNFNYSENLFSYSENMYTY